MISLPSENILLTFNYKLEIYSFIRSHFYWDWEIDFWSVYMWEIIFAVKCVDTSWEPQHLFFVVIYKHNSTIDYVPLLVTSWCFGCVCKPQIQADAGWHKSANNAVHYFPQSKCDASKYLPERRYVVVVWMLLFVSSYNALALMCFVNTDDKSLTKLK